MRADEIARRLDSRSGYELITYREVGLPVLGIFATALVIERQERSCIEEFALRAVSLGLETPFQIQGILGLPQSVIDSTLADLVRQEAVRMTGESDNLFLTSRGKQIVGEADLLCPSEQTIWFPFDGLLRRPKWYGEAALLKPKEARESGFPLIKAFPARPPEVEELSAPEVSDVVRLAAGAEKGDRDVLRITAIEKRLQQYLPAVALVYRARQGEGIQVAFAIDGRISQEHELAFARGGGLERQPIFGKLKEKVSLRLGGLVSGDVADVLEVASTQRSNAVARVTASRSDLDKAALALVSAQTQSQRDAAAANERRAEEAYAHAESALREGPVRPLPVYEHPALLWDALATAVRRLLIISPWIRRGVVNEAFLRGLRQACGRGVRIAIGFGLGDDFGEKSWDKEARKKLENLAKELPLLVVRRLGDTHAKILVKDSEYFVISSFNWLSFQGDPSKPFREEWGTIVRSNSLVDQFYADIIKRFELAESKNSEVPS